MAYSFKSIVDGGSDSDLVYYNCTLTATKTNGLYLPTVGDTQIKFNETRDAPIIKDASQKSTLLIYVGASLEHHPDDLKFLEEISQNVKNNSGISIFLNESPKDKARSSHLPSSSPPFDNLGCDEVFKTIAYGLGMVLLPGELREGIKSVLENVAILFDKEQAALKLNQFNPL